MFPDHGSYSGGTLVTIVGRHFTGATAVYFGTRPAAGFSVLDDRTILAVPPRAAGRFRSPSPHPTAAPAWGTSSTCTGPVFRGSSPPPVRSAGAMWWS
ncbi:IPT/TIG domain-containing protein [Streptomyces sp. 2114.4]|uniref:IPT/TIG domain-containing protein n=1 Tax=Streptomyces sp. 2114.4 TaxID=1938836 RepID=UPI003594498C